MGSLGAFEEEALREAAAFLPFLSLQRHDFLFREATGSNDMVEHLVDIGELRFAISGPLPEFLDFLEEFVFERCHKFRLIEGARDGPLAVCSDDLRNPVADEFAKGFHGPSIPQRKGTYCRAVGAGSAWSARALHLDIEGNLQVFRDERLESWIFVRKREERLEIE